MKVLIHMALSALVFFVFAPGAAERVSTKLNGPSLTYTEWTDVALLVYSAAFLVGFGFHASKYEGVKQC